MATVPPQPARCGDVGRTNTMLGVLQTAAMQPLRWGVIGATSKIYNNSLKPAFEASVGHRIVGEASRADGGDDPYGALLERSDVDAVYIPLPNDGHKPWILRALAAGKHVLCEKPLTMSTADTVEVFEAAEAANLTLMEAYMWPHHPRARRVLELVAAGAVGELRSIRSVFTYPSSDPTNHRLDERGAGALFDVGIYCIGPAMLLAQRNHVAVAASAVRNDKHVDVSMTGFVDWGDGLGSSFDVSFESPHRRLLEIAGTDGNSRNCSGASATLLPAIAATRSRMDVLYGPGRDFIQIGTARPPAGSPELERLARHASCDSEGNFRFSNVPDGSFFVTAGFKGRPVASVKRQVDVRGGQNESVLLTDR